MLRLFEAFIKERVILLVVLVSANSRVSPLHKTTISRLEFIGNLLLTRLTSSVINNLPSAYNDKTFAWMDFSIAYAWIQNINKVYKAFIHTRVQFIREVL